MFAESELCHTSSLIVLRPDMRGRWACAAFVACLLLVALRECPSHCFAKELIRRPRKIPHGDGDGDQNRPVSGCTVSAGQLKSKKNNSFVDDDKRAVPTGPNPLHNR